jgi:hypothetical protein
LQIRRSWRMSMLGRMLPVVAFGSFDGLAHAARRHGVQLVCGMSPGRSGEPQATACWAPMGARLGCQRVLVANPGQKLDCPPANRLPLHSGHSA